MFVPNPSEAATMRLIKTILFGWPLIVPAPVLMAKRRPRRSPRTPPAPTNPYAASNAEFFRSIVLHKHVVKAPCSPVTPVPPAPAALRPAHRAFDPSGPSFPMGLCYLVGVAPSDRGAAMLTLGSYPQVSSLMNSWLFQPAGIHLIPRSPGLYHAVSSDVVGSVPFCLGLPGWKVGADETFLPLPRNTNRPRMSDNRPPTRPPRYFEDSAMDPSNRSSGAFHGGGDRGLPSFGPYGHGAGRGHARA